MAKKKEQTFTRHQVITLLRRYGNRCVQSGLIHGYADLSAKDFLDATINNKFANKTTYPKPL